MVWKEAFEEGREVVLATASCGGVPRANIVVSLGWIDARRLLIADCQMQRTMHNLQENPLVCVIGGYIRLTGSVEMLEDGPLFDRCVQRSKGYVVRHAIVVTAEEVFDLDAGKVVEPASQD